MHWGKSYSWVSLVDEVLLLLRTTSSKRTHSPPAYSSLKNLFGDAVLEIRDAFLSLDQQSLEKLLIIYGKTHGSGAEAYARKTFLIGEIE